MLRGRIPHGGLDLESPVAILTGDPDWRNDFLPRKGSHLTPPPAAVKEKPVVRRPALGYSSGHAARRKEDSAAPREGRRRRGRKPLQRAADAPAPPSRTRIRRRDLSRRGSPPRYRSPLLLFGVLGAVLTASLTLALHTSAGFSWLLAYLSAVNVVTFGFYAYDKSIAKSTAKSIAGFDTLRVPEKALHLLALAGGTPFALLAQEILRHKTAKLRFRVVFWLLATLQIALVVLAALYWRR